MKILRYSIEYKPKWDEYVGTAKNGHFMHRRDYMEYHSDRFCDHSLLFIEDNGEILALLPASQNNDTLNSHEGLTFGGLITSTNVRAKEVLHMFDALVAYARDQGIKRIVYKAIPQIYHQAPANEDEYALFLQGAKLFRVDISTTIDNALPIPFSSLRKRGAKKAEKAGVTVSPSDDYVSYHAILRGILEDKYEAHVTHSGEELRLLAGRFPDNIKLYAAYEQQQMIAGVLIFETATVAHAQYIGASERGRELGALDLLFAHLIRDVYAIKRYFDFGISTEKVGKYLNENLIAQKEGFGGRGTVHKFFEMSFD